MQFLAEITLLCEECNSKRFKKETLEVQVHGKNIADVLEMTIDEAIDFFSENSEDKKKITNPPSSRVRIS